MVSIVGLMVPENSIEEENKEKSKCADKNVSVIDNPNVGGYCDLFS